MENNLPMNAETHNGNNVPSGELEHLLNRGDLFFWFYVMGLLLSTGVLCFDSFVVGG